MRRCTFNEAKFMGTHRRDSDEVQAEQQGEHEAVAACTYVQARDGPTLRRTKKPRTHVVKACPFVANDIDQGLIGLFVIFAQAKRPTRVEDVRVAER